ncbi:PHB depolymerase family esterase [Nonomuraea sp. NPDC000554]|uniref:alpha/beta hydrolase family esterase n=1 Tax=Nonomuraea sp. NPDC000554 TaxID=3154259 RepID=UPI00332A19CA
MPHARITRGSIDVVGRRRSYTLVAPPDVRPGGRLILVFPGSKQSGGTFRALTGGSFDSLATGAAAVVAYLDGYKGQWNDACADSSVAARVEDVDDVAFATAMVGALEGSHRIDRSKVYAAGFSSGGGMVIRLVHQVPGLLAGATVIAATQPAPENFLLGATPAVPIPMLLIHGTRDRLVPYDGGMIGGRMHRLARWMFHSGGLFLSAPQTAAYFAARNSIDQPPGSLNSVESHAGSGTTSVTATDYRQADRPPVTLYTVHGGGHTVPGPRHAPRVMGRTCADLNTAEAIGEFFGLTRP